ncbi:hypothetical protein LTR97_003455 [Elasticomyces elasticus]|uniref:Heterokaryon incompatibility domain-containing protein n=1 Tax=Elasticomyces elasticus TaxID=574655 RepID=A0AAN7WEF2_9PEZI|nr:hypothetical protein LTR97_003455 [Elasticomyces elasticus]
MRPANYLVFDMHSWKHEIDDSPLGKRAWCLQERALSPRTIHFGKTQIAWECRQLACNEVFQDEFLKGTIRRRAKEFLLTDRKGTEAVRTYEWLKSQRDQREKKMLELRAIEEQSGFDEVYLNTGPRSIWHQVSPRKSKVEDAFSGGVQLHNLIGLEAELLDELNLSPRTRVELQWWDLAISPTNVKPPRYKYMSLIQQKWCDIVEAYTECILSYTSDKLVAIAGMAQMVSHITQCQYLAGLWRKDLEHQLLWKVVSPSPAAAVDGTRGPSWSWASVDGGVEWEHWQGGSYPGKLDDIKWLARIESCKVKTITPNLFGQVASGSLVITGPLVVLKLSVDEEPEPEVCGDMLEACGRGNEVDGADIFWDSLELYELFGNKRRHSAWKYKIYHAAPTHDTSSYGEDMFFMPIRLMDYNYNQWDYEAPMLQGLLLLPCPGVRGTYQRIGHLTLSEHQMPEALNKWQRILRSGTKIADRKFFQSALKNGEYTIVIV